MHARKHATRVIPVMRVNSEIPFADTRQLDFAPCSIQRSNIAEENPVSGIVEREFSLLRIARRFHV